jgi:hypothetical protein
MLLGFSGFNFITAIHGIKARWFIEYPIPSITRAPPATIKWTMIHGRRKSQSSHLDASWKGRV